MSIISKDYIAVIHKDEDSDYGVSFPDFTGCITCGSTLEEAKEMAKEALQFHIDEMVKDKDVLPDPTSLDTIKESNPNAEAFLLINAKIPAKSVRINISIDEALLRKLDQYLKNIGDNRSHFFSQSIKQKLQGYL